MRSSHRRGSAAWAGGTRAPGIQALVVTLALLASSHAGADYLQTYELEGDLIVISSVGPDISPLSGGGETPVWTTGLVTDDALPPFGPNTNSTVKYNEEDAVPAAEGVISYETSAQVTTNSITLCFKNADSSGLDSIGDGEIEIVDFDFHYRTRSNVVFDQILVVYGLTDSDTADAKGVLSGGVVDEWTQDASGIVHSEVMCHGSCGLAGIPIGELIVEQDDNGSMPIDVTGEYPQKTEGSTTVPASVGMTFSPDYSTVTFESTMAPAEEAAGGVPLRARLVYEGTAVATEGAPTNCPEPGQLLMNAIALVPLVALGRARRRSRRS